MEGYNGINTLDSMCKLHDKFYNVNIDTKTRNISDIALAHRANEIANTPMYEDTLRKDANFISRIMKTKARFGLGVKSKNSKKGPMKKEVIGPFEQLSKELCKQIRRKFPRRQVTVYGKDD